MSVQSNSNFNASGNSLLRNSEGNQCVFNDYVAPSSSDNSNHPSNSSTTSEESGGNSNPRSNSSTTSDEANFLSKTIENRPEVTINPSDLVKIDHVAKPCMFFAQGTCRNGRYADQINYSNSFSCNLFKFFPVNVGSAID